MTDDTTPAPLIERTHLDHDGGTETRLTISQDMVTASVRLLPGYRHWTAPTAVTMRAWVDDALTDTGRERSGSRTEHDTHPGWLFTYPLATKGEA